MSTTTEAIVAGVISGVLATGLAAVIRSVWTAMIYPHIENCLYGDIRIDGEWRSTFRGVSFIDSEVITIVQVGHRISGSMQCYEGPDKGRAFKFTGEFRNRILTGMYVSQKPNSLDRGTFALQIEDNGERLSGQCIYYRDPTNTLEVAAEYTWIRSHHGAPFLPSDASAGKGHEEATRA